MTHFAKQLTRIAQRRASDGYRQTRVNGTATGRTLNWQGQDYLNFSSNDYLGLAQHPAVIQAYQQTAAEYGVGSGGSPLVTGNQRPHQMLCDELCDWLDVEQVLLLTSGFAANQMILKTLLGKRDLLVQDKLNHASLMDAGMSSDALMRGFLHNDSRALTKQLHRTEGDNRLVVTEGVFSMDGDQAPLAEIASICQEHDSWLMVDDAHGIGVLGNQGRGSCDQWQVKPQILMATFGKAFGVGGAMVGGHHELIEFFTNFGREYIYSTAMPAAQAAAIQAALKLIKRSEQQQQLQENIQLFKRLMRCSNWRLMPSDTAIQPILIGSSTDALEVSRQLALQGIWVSAIRPPTVPPGQARLRVTITAAHRVDDLQRLAEALGQIQLTTIEREPNDAIR